MAIDSITDKIWTIRTIREMVRSLTTWNRDKINSCKGFASWSITKNQSSSLNQLFGGYMASTMFRSNLAESSTRKVDDAYIESDATHLFLNKLSEFLNYNKVNKNPVLGATGIPKIVGE